MRNPLQEQLLKAGLAKKGTLDKVAREQEKLRRGKVAPANTADQLDAERARQDQVERDRALAAERNAVAKAAELRAQVRQIVEQSRLPIEGDSEYRFSHGGVIRTVLVTAAVRRQLAAGSLVIACHGPGYAIIPRAAAEKVAGRDPSMIAVDHGRNAPPAAVDGDADSYYDQFKVPDDLVW